MKNIVSVIIENDGYLVKNSSNDGTFTRVMPQGIQRIPCIPFYHSAWLIMGNLLKPAVTDFVDVINSQYGKIKNTYGMAAYPADALPADIRMIQQTLEYAGFKGLKMVSKTSLLKAEGLTNYIAISASERLVVLEWYRDGIPTESRYYNKVSVGRNRLLSDIEKIQKRQAGSKLKVFVFDGCAELAGLYTVGELVDENRALKLLVKTGYEQYKVKNAPEVEWGKDEKKDVKEPAFAEMNTLELDNGGENVKLDEGVKDNISTDDDIAIVCVPEAIGKKEADDSDTSASEEVDVDMDLEKRLAIDINEADKEFDEWAYKQALGEDKE